MRAIDKQTLEQTARIIGPQSAAAQALAEARAHDGEVRFWRDGSVIVVEKLPAPPAR